MTFLDFIKDVDSKFNPLLKKKAFISRLLIDVEKEIFLKDTTIEDMRSWKKRREYRKLFIK